MKLVVGAMSTVGTAVRGISANRMRAALSLLGIAIGVATLVGLYAMMEGLKANFAQQFARLGANTLYITSRPWVMRGDWWKYRNRPPITRKDVESLRANAPLLTAIAPLAVAQSEVSYQGDAMTEVFVRGTTDEYLETQNISIATGRFLSPIDVEADQPVVVIGADLVDAFFRGIDPLGAKIRIKGQRYTVVGTLTTQGKAFGQSLDKVVIIPIDGFGRIFGARRNLSIAVATDPMRLHEAQEQVIEVLRRSRGLSAEQDENFSVNQQKQIVEMFNDQMAGVVLVALLIGVIALLVGSIGVMNIMLVAVTERTREIGVRRALGARRSTILGQFLVESSLLTAVGGAIGTALGFLIVYVLSNIAPIVPPASFGAAVVAVLVSGGIGILCGTWPAWRAARLDPIESLRHE